MGRWLTPSGEPDVSPCCVSLPASPDWLAAFLGALLLLAEADNWEQHGDKTPEETASVWEEIALDFYKAGECNG